MTRDLFLELLGRAKLMTATERDTLKSRVNYMRDRYTFAAENFGDTSPEAVRCNKHLHALEAAVEALEGI